MYKYLYTFLNSFLLTTALGYAFTPSEMKDRMVGDLELIHHIFDAQYAPMNWKQEYASLNFTAELKKYKQQIIDAPTVSSKEFHLIVNAFLGTAKDYHVKARYNSTEEASLPFVVQRIDGRCFISWVDPDILSPRAHNINVGDELLFFGDRPVHEVLQELENHSGLSSNPATDRSIADMTLTSRKGSWGHKVPNGSINLTTLTAKEGIINTFQLLWNYTPEKITSPFDESVIAKLTAPKNPLLVNDMLSPFSDFQAHRLAMPIGSLAPLGDIVYEFLPEEYLFYGYIYENNEGDFIGYIRIPHYRGTRKHVDDFGAIMNFFQENTKALVIDQTDNPGGSVLYLYTLASILANKPLSTPLHRIAITPQSVSNALANLEALDLVKTDKEAEEVFEWGHPVSFQSIQYLKEHYRFIINEWNQGKTLTNPTFLMVDHINPHPYYRYKKPILFLINELDFSGGDFLPAILQDNQRVTLMGTRTAGAGGYVLQMQFPNFNGIDFFTVTGSIAERADQSVIENLGVNPDIEYQISVKDIQQNYQPYISVINDKVKSMIKSR